MSKRKSCLGIALMLGLMALTGWMLFRDQPFSRLAGTLSQVRPGWILLGLALMLVFVGCEALCSRLILGRLGHRVPYHSCLGYSFAGFYFSSITPSATGGQPAQIYYMSKDGVPAAHGTLNMMLIAVCYQVTVLGYALVVLFVQPGLLTNLGGGLGLLLVYGAVVNLALTAGMLCLMFLPNAARRLARAVLALLVKLHIVRSPDAAQEKLEHQLSEYRRGADCVRHNPGLVPMLLALTALQLTASFSVPLVVYQAFGLSGHRPFALIGTQALITLAVASLPLPGAVGASEGGFVKAMALFFGSGLVTPAVLVSRGISFYAFLLVSGVVTLCVHLRRRRKECLPARPKLAPSLPRTGSKIIADG